MDNLEKKILEDIEKTGFVNELKIVTLLNENGWRTIHSGTYEDKDKNLSREIDIIASKVEYIKKLGFRLVFYLIIEAKKSERPWIIFTTNRRYTTIGWSIMNKGHNDKEKVDLPDGTSYLAKVFDYNCISKNCIRNDKPRVGKAYHELGKNPGDPSKIYEGLIGVCKAANYYCEKYTYDEDEPKEFILDKITDQVIYLPTIVLDGQLFEVFNNNETGKIETQKQSYIPVELPYSSPNYRQGNWDVKFYPDIVTFDAFLNHLATIENWRKTMLNEMIETLTKKGKQPETR